MVLVVKYLTIWAHEEKLYLIYHGKKELVITVNYKVQTRSRFIWKMHGIKSLTNCFCKLQPQEKKRQVDIYNY